MFHVSDEKPFISLHEWTNLQFVCVCSNEDNFGKSLMFATRVPWDGPDPEVKEIWELSTYTILYESM